MGLEEHILSGFSPTSVEAFHGYAGQEFAAAPSPSGPACCAIEMMATGAVVMTSPVSMEVSSDLRPRQADLA